MAANHDKQEWLKHRARELRRNQTVSEKLLWELLRGRRLAGLKFIRQYSFGNVIRDFIVDFICREKRLMIEIDGDSHADRGEQDFRRQAFLESRGYRVLRIANDDVLTDIEGIAFAIGREAGRDPVKWRDGIAE